MSTLAGKKILLGITGSIAAYKSLQVLRDLTGGGANVQVVLTPSAVQFVPPLTLQVFSGRPVYSELFDPKHEVLHLTLAQEADLVLVAPATAHFIAKAALGLADDLLSTLLLGLNVPLLLAPAMDVGMWDHLAVQQNVSTLKERGVGFVGPASGPLASGKSDVGRMADPSDIAEAVKSSLSASSSDLRGEVILVTAGPTHEPIDPVRYITNRSSGKMGYAVAARAQKRGARVLLVSGPTSLSTPPGVKRYAVRTAEEMEHEVLKRFTDATVLVMAAAVSDFRLKEPFVQKIKKDGKSGLTLELTETADILAKVRAQKRKVLLVGFAAETEGLLDKAKRKLIDKGLDLIVANDIGQEGIGFDSDENEVTLLGKSGEAVKVARSSKFHVADRILDAVCKLR